MSFHPNMTTWICTWSYDPGLSGHHWSLFDICIISLKNSGCFQICETCGQFFDPLYVESLSSFETFVAYDNVMGCHSCRLPNFVMSCHLNAEAVQWHVISFCLHMNMVTWNICNIEYEYAF